MDLLESLLRKDVQEFSNRLNDSCNARRVLLLPPRLNAAERFNVHRMIENYPNLKSCSVGEGEDRRRMLILPRDMPIHVLAFSGKHAVRDQIRHMPCWKKQQSPPVDKNNNNFRTVAKKMAGETNEADDWESLYADAAATSIEPEVLANIERAVGKVTISQTSGKVSNISHPKAEEQPQIINSSNSSGLVLDADYQHVLELSGFIPNTTAADLMASFRPLARDDPYQIIWVDDTHCLAVFETAGAAQRILQSKLAKPFQVCALTNSTTSEKSRQKAEETNVPRNAAGREKRRETNSTVARRLVINALGLKSPNIQPTAKAKEEQLKLAKYEKEQKKKRQAAEDAWEGKSSH